MVVSRLCLLVLLCGKDGRAVRAPVSRRMWFSCPCLATLPQNVTDQWPGHRGHLTGRDFAVAVPQQGTEAGLLLAVAGGLSPHCQSSLVCFCLRLWVTSCSSPHPGEWDE